MNNRPVSENIFYCRLFGLTPRRPFIKSHLIWVMGLSLFFGACGADDGNSLRGSISQTYGLGFQKVSVEIIPSGDLSIVYVTDIRDSEEREEALNLTLNSNTFPIELGTPINLINTSILTRFRLNTVNGETQEDRESFPALNSGTITFSKFDFLPDAPVQGRFEIRFITGETLLGEFSGRLKFPTS